MQNLEQQFNENIRKWKEHCNDKIHSSSVQDSLDCNAYRNIVAMGPSILPLIRKEYGTKPGDVDEEDSLRWILVNPVSEILGDDFKIPEWMMREISIIAKYTAKWPDENMHKYIKREGGK